MSTARSPWPLVCLLYACGLLAAAQLGKMSALAPVIGAALGLGLTTMAVAISLIELGGATLGSAAGGWAQRVGLRRTLGCAVSALALAGLGGASAQGAASLLAWRVIEAAGYLGVIVSAPVLIAHVAAPAGARTQGLALTLWSSFVPVGLALGAWASASAATVLGWRGAVAAGGVVGGALCLLLWRVGVPASAERGADALTAPPRGPVGRAGANAGALPGEVTALTLAFGGFALFEVGVIGLLPTLLVQETGLDTAAAGRWTALASVSAVAGSAVAAWLWRQGHRLRGPVMVSLGLPPLLLFGVFAPAPPAAAAIALAVLLSMVGGVFASLAFAVLPRLAPAPGDLVRANGRLAQCGASGSLLGPPVMAACVQAGGWRAAALLGLLISLAALPLAWRALATPVPARLTPPA